MSEEKRKYTHRKSKSKLYKHPNTKSQLPKMVHKPDKFIQLYYKQYIEDAIAEGREFNDKLIEEANNKTADILEGIQSDPITFFCPNKVQERMVITVVQAQQESTISTVLFTCANGVGKTTAVNHIIANLVKKPQNAWFDFPLFHNFPYPKHILLITTPTNLSNNYFSTAEDSASLYNLFKDDKAVEFKKNGKNNVSKVLFHQKTGRQRWELSVMTHNQELTEFESMTVGVVILDEPCPEHIWKALPSRLRKGAIILMPMTPLDCDPYIKDDVIDKANNNAPGYRHVEASAYEVVEEQERGHLNFQVLNAQIDRYSEEEKEARVHGKLMYFKERIIDNWNDGLHWVNPSDYPLSPDYHYYHVFDPADGRPNAEIWGAITPEGRHIIFYENPEDQSVPFWEMKGGIPIDDHIRKIRHIESGLEQNAGFNLRIHKRIVDYHFANQTRGVYKRNLLTEYSKKGLNLTQSYKAVKEDELPFGHRRVRELLRFLPDGKPGLVVWNTCYHVRNGITKYVRKRPKTESDFMKPVGSGKIVEKFKDFPDVVRYFCCANVPQPKKKTRRRRKSYNNPYRI